MVTALLAFGQTPSAPAWLVTYPGAHPRTQATPGLLDSTYETEASAADVIAHYRNLFETAGLPFHPNFDGVGTAIRGSAPEGDLLIWIRQQGKSTAVRVDVAARPPEIAPRPSPPPTPPVTRKPAAREEKSGRERVQDMEKFDRPYRPPPRPPLPTLAWPAWLVRLDGERLEGEKDVDKFGRKSLRSTYATNGERNAVQSFYADLLNSHGFPVRSQNSPSWPRNLKGWIEASDHALGEGPRIEIRIEVAPVGEVTQVNIVLSARM